jgi:hypothetical protein
MTDLSFLSSEMFVKWHDPFSGLTSYLLDARVAPGQQTFYYTNRSFTHDGRYFWFYCALPPCANAGNGRSLGLLDVRDGQLRLVPDTAFSQASPGVNLDTGEVYWTTLDAIWKRGPRPDDSPTRVASFPPPHWDCDGPVARIATHLTLSADGSELNIDASLGDEQSGQRFLMGSQPLDGRPAELWQEMDRFYNHGQFSPTDPDLMMVTQEDWRHPDTHERWPFDNRMWLLRRGEKARPIFPDPPRVAHEWWDPDGDHVWYLHFAGAGTERVNIHTGVKTNVWPAGRGHSHASVDGTLLTGDIPLRSPAGLTTAHRVAFFNATTGREVDIVRALPAIPGDRCHAHPHPQFCLHDQLVAYTTSVRGHMDVAFVDVAEAVSATS